MHTSYVRVCVYVRTCVCVCACLRVGMCVCVRAPPYGQLKSQNLLSIIFIFQPQFLFQPEKKIRVHVFFVFFFKLKYKK